MCVILTSYKDQNQLTYRMSLILGLSDCFLVVSFTLSILSLVFLYKLEAGSKGLIDFSLNILVKNVGVLAAYFVLYHIRR